MEYGLANATRAGTCTKINLMEAHWLTGHHNDNEATTRAIAKNLGCEITRGTWKTYEDCAKAKAKRKAIPQKGNQENKAKGPCKQIFTDITSVQKPTREPKTKFTAHPHMRIIVDEYSKSRFIQWFRTKDGMVVTTAELFYKWKTKGKPVKIVRCNGAGENKKV